MTCVVVEVAMPSYRRDGSYPIGLLRHESDFDVDFASVADGREALRFDQVERGLHQRRVGRDRQFLGHHSPLPVHRSMHDPGPTPPPTGPEDFISSFGTNRLSSGEPASVIVTCASRTFLFPAKMVIP